MPPTGQRSRGVRATCSYAPHRSLVGSAWPAAPPDTGDSQSPAADHAARSFVEDLVLRGRIAVGEEDTGDAPIIPSVYTTHEIQTADGALELRRTRFDCGFGNH
jgi:hypothetical protein